MEPLIAVLPWCLAATIVALSAVYGKAYAIRRIDLIDSFWGPAIVLSTSAALMADRNVTTSGLLALALTACWAIRLHAHIYSRFKRSSSQDERYTALVKRWHTDRIWPGVFFRIYMAQALLAVLVGMPVVSLIIADAVPISWLLPGLALWLLGFALEFTADRQLNTFTHDPANKGRVMQSGLWRYSRHPNYFGELLLWWGMWIATIGTGMAPVAVLGPLTITVLILFVSGIPPAERRAASREGWTAYREKTSILLPLPPRTRT